MRSDCGTLLGRPSEDRLDPTAGMPDTGVAERGGGVLERTGATPLAGLIERGYVLGRTGTSLRPVAVPGGGLRILDDGGGGGVDGTPPDGDSDRGGTPERDTRSAVTACIPAAGVWRRAGEIAGVVTVGGNGVTCAATVPAAGVDERLGSVVTVGAAAVTDSTVSFSVTTGSFEGSTSATNTGPGPSSSSLSLPQSESMSSVGGMID